ncbi:MAG: phospholipase D-like domain-containing protein, partial [Streptosporangiaceae bacterium]
DQMTLNGIYVRGHLNCHAKFVVVDDEIALVTSANLMTSALDFTGEDGVVITDSAEVQRLARLFARLWRTGCTYEARPGQAYRLAKIKEQESWPAGVPGPPASGSAGVIWTDGSEQYILSAIQDIVASAESELLLASFGLTRLTQHHALLLDPVRAAISRGATVKLLVRPRRNLSRHLAEAAELAQAGAEIYGDTRTHVKAAIADERHGALFSANFDFDHGLTSGVEVGCRLDGTPALADTTRYLRHAIDQATLIYAARPTHRDLDERLDAEWRVPWPFGERVEVTAASGERAALAQAAEKGPVLFTVKSPGQLELHGGTRRWRLTRGEQDRYELARSASGGGTDSRDTLADWLTTPPRGDRRGICATLIEWAEPG